MCSVVDITQKDVITLKSGTRLGRIDDVKFCKETAVIKEFIIFGRLKCFGLLGREPDITILYKDILNIGTDVVLVRFEPDSTNQLLKN